MLYCRSIAQIVHVVVASRCMFFATATSAPIMCMKLYRRILNSLAEPPMLGPIRMLQSIVVVLRVWNTCFRFIVRLASVACVTI